MRSIRVSALSKCSLEPLRCGLLSLVADMQTYGPSQIQTFRQLGKLLGKVLRGADPGELPVEQPTKFELAVNLKTAKAIGVEVPSSLLLRADLVIE
jgi:putative ABC transport system substrate-binding protein